MKVGGKNGSKVVMLTAGDPKWVTGEGMRVMEAKCVRKISRPNTHLIFDGNEWLCVQGFTAMLLYSLLVLLYVWRIS